MSNKPRIAVDAMGGDFAPLEIVKGSLQGADKYGTFVYLVGDKPQIEAIIKDTPYQGRSDLYEIVHCDEEPVGMAESPAIALKKKRKASIFVANDLVKEGKADAVASAGSTGAAMAGSLLILGRIKGIDRPAIVALMPTIRKHPVVMLDAGANAECKPAYLQQFGIMGSIYAQEILGIENPKVGLINVGEEKEKGNTFTAETYELLEKAPINFAGNMEGRDVLKGEFNVAVCDGFLGNVLLKFAEGAGYALQTMLKEEILIKSGVLGKLGALLLAGSFRSFKKRLDYKEYGGGLLLGVNGISVIAHGSTNAHAMTHTIRLAKEAINHDVVTKISTKIAQIHNEDANEKGEGI